MGMRVVVDCAGAGGVRHGGMGNGKEVVEVQRGGVALRM